MWDQQRIKTRASFYRQRRLRPQPLTWESPATIGSYRANLVVGTCANRGSEHKGDPDSGTEVYGSEPRFETAEVHWH